MKIDAIIKARRVAHEFCNRAELAEAVYDAQEANRMNGHYKPGAIPYVAGHKATGSLRRQSMELTRALAEMRKP